MVFTDFRPRAPSWLYIFVRELSVAVHVAGIIDTRSMSSALPQALARVTWKSRSRIIKRFSDPDDLVCPA
jgi:hypothetical protein